MATHNYLKKLARVLRSLQLPQESVRYVFIAHGEGCAFWRAKPCNCDPELRIFPDPSWPGPARPN